MFEENIKGDPWASLFDELRVRRWRCVRSPAPGWLCLFRISSCHLLVSLCWSGRSPAKVRWAVSNPIMFWEATWEKLLFEIVCVSPKACRQSEKSESSWQLKVCVWQARWFILRCCVNNTCQLCFRTLWQEIPTAVEEARYPRRDDDISQTVILQKSNQTLALLRDCTSFRSSSGIYLPSLGFLLPVTNGSPLLCSGWLPRWFAGCSGRICIGWPTCCFPPPLSPTLLHLLFSLPSFLLSFTWDRSHPLWLTLSLSLPIPTFLSFSPLPVCFSAQPPPPPPVSLPPLDLIFSSSFFSLAFFPLFISSQICLYFFLCNNTISS